MVWEYSRVLQICDMQNLYCVRLMEETLCSIQREMVLLTQCCAGDEIEKNEVGWVCGAYG